MPCTRRNPVRSASQSESFARKQEKEFTGCTNKVQGRGNECLEPFGFVEALLHGGVRKRMEARGGIEPPIKVLQTFALPLGDRAQLKRIQTQAESLRCQGGFNSQKTANKIIPSAQPHMPLNFSPRCTEADRAQCRSPRVASTTNQTIASIGTRPQPLSLMRITEKGRPRAPKMANRQSKPFLRCALTMPDASCTITCVRALSSAVR